MKKLLILIIIVAILIAVGFFWWQSSLLPVNASDRSEKIFVVNQGENIRTIASQLKRENLIRDPIAFFIFVKQQGLEGKMQAGDFRLSPSQSMPQVAENLTHGVLDIWITIPEGKRAEEVAEILKTKLPSYDSSWIAQLKSQEGYLFPDTYLVPRSATSSFILEMMKKNFDMHFANAQQDTKANLTQEQIVTLGSLIEREAKFPEDRPVVASVVANRLAINMALQLDASVQYALGYQPNEKTWWKKNLSADDLKITSPYNDYINTGLPPAPICNPGESSLAAAMHPADTSYLYYISDSAGHLHFAKTLDEHNANIKKYGL